MVYWQVGGFDFVRYDDDKYIMDNPVVRNGLSLEGIRWAFGTFEHSNWHPLTWLSHMLDVQWFGLDAGRHHQVNLLFHILNTLILFIVLQRMTGALWKSGICRSPLRPASPARGVGRLGLGTERSAQRVLFSADPSCL